MRLIRASEIGAYIYCRRAWWYRRQGIQPPLKEHLLTGTELHIRHGRTVHSLIQLRRWAYRLLTVAALLWVIYLLMSN
jgi:CRISPR/Cas system-associated exonuclease Cas4 (RecB family)